MGLVVGCAAVIVSRHRHRKHWLERLVIDDGGDEIGGVVLARRTSLGFRYEVITRSRTPQTKNSKTKLKLTTQTHCWSESM